jgi:aminoglycoside 3-N-acetyltransferase
MKNIVDLVSEHLQALGVREHGVLLVHSSLRSLGKIENAAETLIQALLDALGKHGTLLLPALSYETVGKEHPYFNVRTTPSCVGALSEYFRQREGTLRSIHPTHSVCAIGKQAQEILRDHQYDKTPCGVNSPFHKLPHYKGQILFLGCGLRPNTSMHGIEELSEPPYLFNEMVKYEITDANAQVFKMAVRRHSFKGWIQRYDRLEGILNNDALRTGKVLEAECHLVEADVMWLAAHEKLELDPLYFVERENDNDASSR